MKISEKNSTSRYEVGHKKFQIPSGSPFSCYQVSESYARSWKGQFERSRSWKVLSWEDLSNLTISHINQRTWKDLSNFTHTLKMMIVIPSYETVLGQVINYNI